MATILDASHVCFDVACKTRDEALQFAADKAVELGASSDAKALFDGLKAREGEGSTGMMSGFAIPHCKSASVSEPCVIVLRFAEPVDWETVDNHPVTAAIALFIPDGPAAAEHLSILSKIAVMLMHDDFCQVVKESTDPQQVVDAVNEGLAK